MKRKIKVNKNKSLSSVGHFENVSNYSNISTIAYIKENDGDDDDNNEMKSVIIKCNNVGKGEAILSGINLFDNDLYTSDDKSLLLNLIFSEFGIKISCNNNINSNNSSNNNN